MLRIFNVFYKLIDITAWIFSTLCFIFFKTCSHRDVACQFNLLKFVIKLFFCLTFLYKYYIKYCDLSYVMHFYIWSFPKNITLTFKWIFFCISLHFCTFWGKRAVARAETPGGEPLGVCPCLPLSWEHSSTLLFPSMHPASPEKHLYSASSLMSVAQASTCFVRNELLLIKNQQKWACNTLCPINILTSSSSN